MHIYLNIKAKLSEFLIITRESLCHSLVVLHLGLFVLEVAWKAQFIYSFIQLSEGIFSSSSWSGISIIPSVPLDHSLIEVVDIPESNTIVTF